MLPTLEHPVPWLLARLESATPRWIIGLVGVPGSGKSTLAAQLATEVNARTAPATLVALGMDGFHLPRAALQQFPDPAAAFARRGAPWTFDVGALQQRLTTLVEAAGRADVTWPGFAHDVGDPVPDAYVIPATTRLIIVEGLYLLHQAEGWAALRAAFDERWFLDTPLEVALERLTQRHKRAWGLTHAEATARIAANDRLNAELVLRSRPFADWRVVL